MATLSRFPSLFDLPLDRSNKNLTSLSTITEIRPQTSSNLQPGPRRRRRTDTIDSIRNSIFGARKRSDGDLSSRPHSRHHSPAGFGSNSPITTNSEEEFYRHRKKTSISPPFNFQHISHAAKANLPPLDTVDERDLQQHLYGTFQLAAPPGELHDIKAEKLEERIRLENASYDKQHPHCLTVEDGTPNPNVDETTFDEAQDTRFDPVVCLPSLEPVDDFVRRPRRHASLFSLDQAEEWLSSRTQSRIEVDEPSPTTFESHAHESTATNDSSDTVVPDVDGPHPATSSAVLDVPTADTEFSDDNPRPAGPSPVDQHSNKSRRSAAPSHLSVASFTSSVKSFPSSSSRYTAKSFAISSTGDSHGDYRLSDPSWEEEVDFMYEQEAEATCDFDWQRYARVSGSSYAMSSQTCLAEQSTSQSTLAASSIKYGSTPNLISSPKSPKHARGSSVGHRGFLLARNASAENLGKFSPPKLSPVFFNREPHPSDLSPVPSESTDTFETAPEDYEMVRPVSMGGISANPSIDAKAPRTPMSWHRKSKSYSSYGSFVEPDVPAKKRSRWSIASVACIPEMLYNGRKTRNTDHPRNDSRALKALPQLPDASGAIQRTVQKELPPLPSCPPIQEHDSEEPEPPSTPRSRVFPDDDTADPDEEADQVPVMRRPQSPGERAALQAAGSAVRRSRPHRSMVLSRHSRQLESPRSPPPVGWI